MVFPALLVCCAYVGSISIQADWSQDYAASLQAAKQNNRPLVVVIENTKRPETRAHSLLTANWVLLKEFEVCRVDAATHYGQKVAALYGTSSLPYTVITDANCKKIKFRGAGQFSAATWNTTLRTYLTSNEPSAVARAPKKRSVKPAVPIIPASSQPARSRTADEKRSAAIFPNGNLPKTLRKAKQKSKLTLVFVSMNGCHYCDKMRDETFSDQSVISEVSKYETIAIKREANEEWVDRQQVELFPTTLVLGPNGNLAGRIEGYVSPGVFRSRLRNFASTVAAYSPLSR